MAEVVTEKAAGTAGGLGSDLITKRWPPVWWRCGPPTSHVSAVPLGAKPALLAQAHVVITAIRGPWSRRRRAPASSSWRLGSGEMACGPQGAVEAAVQSWFGLRAYVLRFPAPCPEAAARRTVDRAGHVPLQYDPPPGSPERGVRYRSSREQGLSIRMARVGADVGLITELDV